MLLGVLGPAGGDSEALRKVARYLRDEIAVDRVVYLGVDHALEQAVSCWAEELVGGDPAEDALWRRAALHCARADAVTIQAFLEVERRRRELRLFESLPGEGARDVELFNGKVAVFINDKAYLDEEDIMAASLLVFGKSAEPIVRRVGPRWFISPGDLAHAGVMTLEDREDGIHMTLYDREMKPLEKKRLGLERATKMRVQGSDPG